MCSGLSFPMKILNCEMSSLSWVKKKNFTLSLVIFLTRFAHQTNWLGNNQIFTWTPKKNEQIRIEIVNLSLLKITKFFFFLSICYFYIGSRAFFSYQSFSTLLMELTNRRTLNPFDDFFFYNTLNCDVISREFNFNCDDNQQVRCKEYNDTVPYSTDKSFIHWQNKMIFLYSKTCEMSAHFIFFLFICYRITVITDDNFWHSIRLLRYLINSIIIW